MASITPIAEAYFAADSFLAAVNPEDLVYFVLNVGNGDTQLVLLPEEMGQRTAVVVDVARPRKLRALLDLISALPMGALSPVEEIALLIATHPHADHMGGIPDLLHHCPLKVNEYWDPAYYSTNGFYAATMNELAARPKTRVLHPTAGTQRFIGNTLVTALGPATATRNQYDVLGVEPNNASIGLKIEFPVRAASKADNLRGAGRVYLPIRSRLRRIVLGADAQTDAWATVLQAFPRIDSRYSPLYNQLKSFLAPEPLRALIFKVPHHGSKHNLNLELIERIDPTYSIVTANGSGRGFHFPHQVATPLPRQARERGPLRGSRRFGRDGGGVAWPAV